MHSAVRPNAPAAGFSARSLIGIDDLADSDIDYLLALSKYYAGFLRRGARPPQRLAGKTQVNLFFEDSTRTNLSFELAGKKLGADVLNVPVAASSVNKGETLIYTAQTLAAMGAQAVIVRTREIGVHAELAERVSAAIVNAGDGAREHPTQALLDAAAIQSVYGSLDGRIIAIIGDVRHSRVAGSGARLLTRLGARVRFIGPEDMLPGADDFRDIPRFATLEDGLADADIAMALRMQFERMEDAATVKARAAAYYERFGLTHETLALAKPGAFAMHPGPMNRGIEIDGALADDPERSLVQEQVFYGVAMRMACLDALLTRGVE